jgi:fermentation-respiration switch protein FrsA (DUF1100 family)
LAIGVVLAALGCGSKLVPAAAPRAGSPGGDRPPVAQHEAHYAVGVRVLSLARGSDRPLRTLIFYPATQEGLTTPALLRAGGRNGRSEPGPAAGRFPLVLFSHGLRGTPELYADTLAGWASAGFVVAAPTYPNTNVDAEHFDRGDIVNQPADAAYVIKMVRQLDRTVGDPLAGHIDVDRVAAVGHSAGGYTTTGLFVARHPTWLRAGIVIAGWLAPGAFQGPPASILFLQGARDRVVPLADGRAAYDAVPWWKSYVLLPDSWHADYMLPTGRQYPLMNRTVTNFLHWTLNDDETAHQRLPASSFPTPHAE